MGNNLFKNAKKTAPNHPDWKGEITTPDGKTWELAGWVSTDKTTGAIRSDKNGNPWLSLKATAPRVRDVAKDATPHTIDDEVPF